MLKFRHCQTEARNIGMMIFIIFDGDGGVGRKYKSNDQGITRIGKL